MAVTLVARAFARLAGRRRLWPAFANSCLSRHRDYFEGITQTWGEEMLGPGGLQGAVQRHGPAMLQRLTRLDIEAVGRTAAAWLERSLPLLPGPAPDLYVGVLFFTCPACTLSVAGRPAVAVGAERLTPDRPVRRAGYRLDFTVAELAEMVPHEACHAARLQALGLSGRIAELSLLDMLWLEGTALVFTDRLLGRPPDRSTLHTLLPAAVLAEHARNDDAVCRRALDASERRGLDALIAFFSPGAPVSGYYVGRRLVQRYLAAHGEDSLAELITLPSAAATARLP